MRRGGRWILPISVFLAAAVFWIVFLGQAEKSVFGRVPILDEVYYLDQAAVWSQGDSLPAEPFFVSPLYPILIALTGSGDVEADGRVIDPDVLRGIRIFQVMCWLGVVILLRLMAGRVLGPQIPPGWNRNLVNWLPALLFAMYRPAAVYAVSILLELPLVFLVTLVVFLMTLLSCHRNDRGRGFRGLVLPLLLGLVVGLAGMLRGTSLLLMVPASALVLRESVDRRRGLGAVVLMAAAGLAVLAPAIIHNSRIAGHFTGPTLNAGVNLYIGNGPEANGFYVATVPGDWRRDPAGREYLGEQWNRPTPTLAEADRIWSGEARRTMAERPGRTAGLWLKKVWLHLQGWEIDQLMPLDRWRQSAPALNWLPVPFALLVVLGLAGVTARWRDTRVRWWAAVPAVLIAGQSIFFVVSRYRLVLVPVLCLMATLGAVEILRRNRTALLVAGAAVLITIPWGLENTRDLWRAQALANEAHRWAEIGAAEESDDAFPTAERLFRDSLEQGAAGPAPWLGLAALLVERGERTEAAAILTEGAGAVSWNLDINKALLALWLEDGRRGEALDLTGAILEKSSRDADTLHNRTVLLAEAGRADDAIALAAGFVAVHPGDPRGYIDLGIILARAGRIEEARAVFEEGLKAVPGDSHLQRNLDLLNR